MVLQLDFNGTPLQFMATIAQKVSILVRGGGETAILRSYFPRAETLVDSSGRQEVYATLGSSL